MPKPEPVPEKKAPPKQQKLRSPLSSIFVEPRYPEPVYFQSFDCVGIPGFLSPSECRQIIS